MFINQVSFPHGLFENLELEGKRQGEKLNFARNPLKDFIVQILRAVDSLKCSELFQLKFPLEFLHNKVFSALKCRKFFYINIAIENSSQSSK